jgi:hypothetical protein
LGNALDQNDILLDREAPWRHDKRLFARLHQQARIEDVDYFGPRDLDRRPEAFLGFVSAPRL